VVLALHYTRQCTAERGSILKSVVEMIAVRSRARAEKWFSAHHPNGESAVDSSISTINALEPNHARATRNGRHDLNPGSSGRALQATNPAESIPTAT